MPRNSTSLDAIINRLNDAESRMSLGDFSMARAWFPQYWPGKVEAEILADHGVSTGPEDLTKEFYEEVARLTDYLVDLGDPKTGDPVDDLMEGVNRRARALQLWDWVGIPLRYRNGVVFHISSPGDVFGAPRIESLLASEYITSVAKKTASDEAELQQLRKSRSRWRYAALLLAGLSVLMIFV